MNFEKNERLARKLAREQKHLRKVAKKNPNRLDSRERAMIDWDIEFDNYHEPEHVDDREQHEDHYAR